MAPSRKRASSTTHNRTITAPKKSNQSSETSNSEANSEEFSNAESSPSLNGSKILKEDCVHSTIFPKIKDEPREENINHDTDSETEGLSGGPMGQTTHQQPIKEETSMQNHDENLNVKKEADGKKCACFCGKSYSCNSHLYRHQKKTHGLLIQSTTSKETVIKTEKVEEQSDERFTCGCGRSYTNNSNLKRHKKVCSPDTQEETKEHFAMSPTDDKETDVTKSYVCACGKSYTCSSHLYRHQKTHEQVDGSLESRYVCECGKSYSCNWHLKRHRKKAHPDHESLKADKNIKVEEPEDQDKKLKPYLCFCGKSYTCSSHLYRHQKVHPELNEAIRERCMIREIQPEKQFQCSVCGKTYSCRSHLNRHQKTHREVIHAQDDDCDRGSEEELEETRQKPFICECGKKFILSFSLLLHKKIHCRWKPSNSDSGSPGL